ncbi:c-type cytochrome [Pseudahrensia aquimaris]|uniref:C-type cytochrome n=1 Tax=Pseudahrensia aquimaris TaxID=744461 RepID=A0ABW3FIX9_9HYPH
MKNLKFWSPGGLGLVLLASVFPGSSHAAELLSPDDLPIVTKGREIYQQHCASCHGTNLEGEPNWRRPNADLTMPAPPHDDTGHTWHHSNQVLFNLTKYGLAKYLNQPDYKSNMPAYEGVLTDKEIKAVLSFIESTWSQTTRTHQNRLNKQ